jgi:hypothetical protein
MEQVMQKGGSGAMEEEKRNGHGRPFQSRWVPVAITFLAVASVAAEIWGVVRGLSVIIAR